MAKLLQLKEEENNNKIMKLKLTSGWRLIIPWGQKQVLKVSWDTASQRCAHMAHSEKMLQLNTAVQQCTRYSLRHWHTGKWQMLSQSQTAWALMILMSLILPDLLASCQERVLNKIINLLNYSNSVKNPIFRMIDDFIRKLQKRIPQK